MKRTFILMSMLWTVTTAAYAGMTGKPHVERIEPPSWWVGMETPLQLMIYGPGLGQGTVTSLTPGMEITAVHKADSPNYLFLDIAIPSGASPGDYSLRWTNGKKKFDFTYTLQAREPRSAQREGISPADVLYLLMPDRFINGDPVNDSTPCTAEKSDPANDYGRHGGDLEGIRMSLDYLAELGVTSIWPTPLTLDNEPVVSYHGYACADYYRIDPRFGTNQMYREVVREAASRGISFLQDLVPNHCGTAHWWMQDLPFKDWIHVFDSFTRSNYAMITHMDPNAAAIDRELCIQGWFDTSMPDMNLGNPFVLQYFIQVSVWWIEYAGLAGLRIDTYPYSDETAISSYTAALRNEYPNGTVLAECWYNYPHQVAYWERGPWPNGPTVMDFSLMGELSRSFTEDRDPQWGQGMVRLYNMISNDFVYKNPNELLVFGENHDVNRMYEMLGRNPEKLKMAYAFLATTRGIPQIYYGTEVLLAARDSKKLGHGEERVSMPARVLTPEGRDPLEENVYRYISRLLTWRKSSPTVQYGRLLHFLPRYEENMYVYFRILDDECVMVLINNGQQPVQVDWQRYAEGLGKAQKGKEVLSGMEITVGQPVQVPAQTAIFFTFAGI
ncbi:MAG: alpha-amylase family glycosyl hydrolase [Bacteroidales bacterium]|nr:alpha-amylase family glycosyl hydrolase [Bacteroidales bacterium]MDD3944267.1 alpha-amylase family glycosyl hydrolase [Bacteroidales bacterium]